MMYFKVRNTGKQCRVTYQLDNNKVEVWEGVTVTNTLVNGSSKPLAGPGFERRLLFVVEVMI